MADEKKEIVAMPQGVNLPSVGNLTMDVIKSEEFSVSFRSLIEYYKALESVKKEYEAKIKQILEDHFFETGDNAIDTPQIKFTVSLGGTKTTFNEKEFKAEHPEIYIKYKTTSDTGSRLTTTLKKEKDVVKFSEE